MEATEEMIRRSEEAAKIEEITEQVIFHALLELFVLEFFTFSIHEEIEFFHFISHIFAFFALAFFSSKKLISLYK